MKHRQPCQILAMLFLTGAATFSVPEPSKSAGKGLFFCGQLQGKWNTFVKRPKRNIAIIEWTSNDFADSGWDNRKRCITVSDRFNQYAPLLTNVKTSNVNGYPVICVPKVKGGSCAKNEVLFTLKAGINPEEVAQKLFNMNRYGNPSKFRFTEQPFSYDSEGELNINVETFINNLEEIIEASENEPR
ncbi:COP23 domain-containing protein [Microcystis aeruginosa]|jgi:hypothetical protein|nr:COP23 domain-containing protein [Microcystis aeruginosa]MDY7048798.1 COP23 domain-containing protein [Microcystis panniformis WG22]TRU07821.1 MAG: hypothetical protein EWV61_00555 [Microcystis aeruginosa Ma_AC_P_19900807_S300]ELS46283.1 hypothetical protein C789_3940 [Microcystis aeruginosa FACHB-905 = DIANCHI905]UGS10843.1 COP23 domain-containing protein [Microcystis aeruginosa FACHB-905 = DIANCHI905]WKX61971.1 COP23 domain-containing protein [Microcystis aeruginosa PCC 7806]